MDICSTVPWQHLNPEILNSLKNSNSFWMVLLQHPCAQWHCTVTDGELPACALTGKSCPSTQTGGLHPMLVLQRWALGMDGLAGLPTWSSYCSHDEPLTLLGLWPLLPSMPPLLPPPLSLIGAQIWAQLSHQHAACCAHKPERAHVCPVVHVSPLLTHIHCCLIQLHLQNTHAKIKLLRIQDGGHDPLNQIWGVGAVACTGCTRGVSPDSGSVCRPRWEAGASSQCESENTRKSGDP